MGYLSSYIKMLGREASGDIERLVYKFLPKNDRAGNFDLNLKWSVKSKSFDVITATEVIEHLIDLDNFFSEVKRALKDRGKLIISTENLAGYHNIFTLLLGNQPYTGPYLSRRFSVSRGPSSEFYDKGISGYMNPHINVMTYKALILILKKYGFTILKNQGVGFYP